MTAADGTIELKSIPPRATGAVIVDLAGIASNWRALAAQVATSECAAVVKADAYGLGASRIIPILVGAGCRTFFVATPDEAEQARQLAPAALIYVLDGVLDAALLASVSARPVLADPADIRVWLDFCESAGVRAPAALQIDTGLNRRGLSRAQLDEFVSRNTKASFDLTLLMSHLACADDPASPMNWRQREAFLAGHQRLPGVPASLAASDGLMLGKPFHFDLVRPGYALYGGQAFRGGRAPVEPVVRAYARVLQIRDVPAGEAVGYSATWRTKSKRRIATIAAGYADGVFRHASGTDDKAGGLVAIDGHLCPIVGRVSMDLVTADVTDALEERAEASGPPQWAEMIGPSLTIETVGTRAETIGYEVLTRLGRRFHRVYLG
jgi:alanine racemase